MTGIGGVHMWLEDYLINASTYNNKYRENFLKVVEAWRDCTKDFKSCTTIAECNNTSEKWVDKVVDLRQKISDIFGKNEMPCGISDTLDYFEDAVGELEDKAIDRVRG